MKFCMIGCGGHASTAHGPAQRACAAQFPDLELAACCDRDESRAAAYRTQFGYKRQYRDAQEMIAAEHPDAICLVLPTQLMADAAEPLLARGMPLLMEKPPGLNRAELDRLVAAAARGKGLHLVAFNRRFMPAVARTRALLEATLPPESVLSMDYVMLRYARTDPDFSTTAIHAFDAALYLARSPYRRAAFTYRELPALGAGVADVSVEAEFVCGTRAHFRIQPVCGHVAEHVEIHGVDHTFFAEIQQKQYTHWHKDQIAEHGDATSDASLNSLGFFEETAAFVQALRAGTPAAPMLTEIRQSVEMMEAMRNRRARAEW